MKKNNILRGFTLLEMLIVIAIISILVGMGTVSYSTSQKKARDAKRRSDLKAVQNCMEQYYSVNSNQYEYEVLSGTLTSSVPIKCGDSKTLSVEDPLNSASYVYTVTSSTISDYTITADLEGDGTITVNNLQ